MNWTIKKISAWLLLMLCMSSAFADRGQRQHEREYQRQEQQMPSQAERYQYEERQARPPDAWVQEEQHGAPRRGSGRMSPEERRALRRQINEAGRDIYAPNR